MACIGQVCDESLNHWFESNPKWRKAAGARPDGAQQKIQTSGQRHRFHGCIDLLTWRCHICAVAVEIYLEQVAAGARKVREWL